MRVSLKWSGSMVIRLKRQGCRTIRSRKRASRIRRKKFIIVLSLNKNKIMKIKSKIMAMSILKNPSKIGR